MCQELPSAKSHSMTSSTSVRKAGDTVSPSAVAVLRLISSSLSVPKTPSIGFAIAGESEHDCWMFAIAFLFVRVLCDCFKSRRLLEAEVLVLRHQLNVLQQRVPRRLYLSWADRALFVWLYRGFPRILDAITILRPETIVRWHRKGFSAYWRWKSRSLCVYRKPHPAMIFVLAGEIPCSQSRIPCSSEIIPCSV